MRQGKRGRTILQGGETMKRKKLLATALLPIALMLASCVIVPTNSHVNLSAADTRLPAPSPSSAAYIASNDVRYDVDWRCRNQWSGSPPERSIDQCRTNAVPARPQLHRPGPLGRGKPGRRIFRRRHVRASEARHPPAGRRRLVGLGGLRHGGALRGKLRRRADLRGPRARGISTGRSGRKASFTRCSRRTTSTGGASTAGGPKTSSATPPTSTAPT